VLFSECGFLAVKPPERVTVDTIARYEVRRKLTSGTTPLYEGVDTVLRRAVIIRTLSHVLAVDPERRARFLDAAMLAARISSPHVSPILDLGDDHGNPYVVMEFPEGASLRTVMDDPEPHTIDFRVGVISQLCDALTQANKAGVSQLGLRPPGIFVSGELCVTVVPFGTIPIHGSRGTLTALSLEDVAYLAPELVEGCVSNSRADIFSLGVIAYELMARRKPFQGSNVPTLLHELVHKQPDAGALESSRYSPILEKAILKALARNPSERYTEAGAMLADLDTLICDASAAKAVPDVDGRFDEGQALADRLEARKPKDPSDAPLRGHLGNERAAEALLAMAQQHVARGNLREARAAAVEALILDQSCRLARGFVRQLDWIFIVTGNGTLGKEIPPCSRNAPFTRSMR
jgi:serine/threonine protein kinase